MLHREPTVVNVRHTPLRAAAVLLLALFALPDRAQACTTFCVDGDGQLLVGRNQDWPFDKGMIVVNRRDQAKTALVYWGEGKEGLAAWTSRFGSVTFVQHGRDIALGGMNEAGLVVNAQWLEATRYPAPDRRPSVSVDQYVQFLLDTCATVGEVLASDGRVRVRQLPSGFAKLHFIVTDAAGNAAVLEFLDGKLVSTSGDALKVKAMANDTYEASLRYDALPGGAVPGSVSSLDRFVRAAAFASAPPAPEAQAVPAAFGALDSVKQYNTHIQIVFDVKRRTIHYRSSGNRAVRSIRLDAFDFSCEVPAKMLDLDAGEGDVTDAFVVYSTDVNEALVVKGLNALGHSTIYPPALQLVSRYPESFFCPKRPK